MRPLVDRSTGWSDTLYNNIEARLAERQAEAEARVNERVQSLRDRGIECLECEDTGMVVMGQYFCECVKGQELNHADYERARSEARNAIPEKINIPKRYKDMTFDTFPDQSSAALEAVRDWVDSDRPVVQPGLFLYGSFGRGKTGLIVAALREIAWRGVLPMIPAGLIRYTRSGDARGAGAYAWFVTATALLESLRPHDDDSQERMLEKYRAVDYLAIDDIGAERLTEWGVDRLFEIVNHRHSELLPMMVSSNLSPGELAKRINKQIGDQSGDRIVERLIESCTVIRFDDAAPNWRLAR